jgi:hypothetical protein
MESFIEIFRKLSKNVLKFYQSGCILDFEALCRLTK